MTVKINTWTNQIKCTHEKENKHLYEQIFIEI